MGTPDFSAAWQANWDHGNKDVTPFVWAAMLDGYKIDETNYLNKGTPGWFMDMYFDVRPPNKGPKDRPCNEHFLISAGFFLADFIKSQIQRK